VKTGGKKNIRAAFRKAVFQRSKYRCECCGVLGRDRQGGDDHIRFHRSQAGELHDLDAHHITNRNEMPGGGYVAENGIAVCDACHLKAEEFWSTGVAVEGFSPEELYERIGSSYEAAVKASERL
jgi:predicted restriction endonuclease